MKELAQEPQHKVKATGSRLASKRSRENAISGEQKDSAQKETRAVSATMKTNVGNQRPVHSHSTILRKQNLSEAAVLLER